MNSDRIILALAATAMLAAAEPAEPPSVAEAIYEKAVAAGIGDAERAYAAYQKALEAAQQKVLKQLETAKADLNNPTKGRLTVQERMQAISELDERIAQVRDGELGDRIVAGVDLLGESALPQLLIPSSAFAPTGPRSAVSVEYSGLYLAHDGIEFAVSLPPGTYYLHALYAAQQARPCRLSLKERELGTGLAKVSGSWRSDKLMTDVIGPFRLGGKATLRLAPAGGLAPHLFGLCISPRKQLELKPDDFKTAR